IKAVSFTNIELSDGFWKDRQTPNSEVTIGAVRDRFIETGRFEAFKFNYKHGDENVPHYFWDSDVAKWIESVAYILRKKEDKLLEAQADELIELIEKNQCEDGYFNIYFTVVKPNERFSDRDCHELYCAGHLIEAAVAYYYATGKDKLLKCMCRYADLIEKVFKIDRSAAFVTPGHEEIELALINLYKCTGEKRYLELSKFFIDMRGVNKETPDDFWAKDIYYQSHKPCREQFTAEGHSVRACYLYSGMADIAREYNDNELKEACEKIFDDIYYKKMYITAGIGQSHCGEAFTVPYDLQNGNAYTETCAAIALVLFSHRMQKLKLDSRYGDVIERAIYNGVLSGVSLDGKSFFYENPLEIKLRENSRNVSVRKVAERHPITQRVEVFDCSCCPPNITRFIASIGNYIYGNDESTIYFHQFISSKARINGAEIEMKSGYPYDGKTNIKITDGKTIAIRIPQYTKDNFEIKINGDSAEYKMNSGYAFINVPDIAEIELDFDVSPKKIFANPNVYEDIGKCAIIAGPLVYCAEGYDNGDNIFAYRISEINNYVLQKNPELGTTNIEISAEKFSLKNFDGLYSQSREFEAAKLKLIPYFAFANRGETDMCVWFSSK
ncbi:MAG: glycoside hydrolase family 127 protein, partial [Ruminococcus sp.]|nr:glycoside hydrolase family 127 protein [Candidatus Copronaster equi]